MDKAIQYCLNIYCPDNLLWWLIIICLIGLITTGGAMMQIGKFVVTKQDEQASVIKLQGIHTIYSANKYLSSLTNKSLKSLRSILLIDFAFMPFLYFLMVIVTSLSQRHHSMGESWSNLLYYLSLLPLLTWAFDIIENFWTLSIITAFEADKSEVKKSQTVIMSVSSVLKWITGLIWVQVMISLLITCLVER